MREPQAHALSAAAGAVLGTAATLIVVFALRGDPASASPMVPSAEMRDAVDRLAAAADALGQASADLRMRGAALAPRVPEQLDRRPAPEPEHLASAVDDVAALVERLENVAALLARQAGRAAGSDWGLPGVQSGLGGRGDPRPDAIVRAATALDADEARRRRYLFRAASDMIAEFGTPEHVVALDSGALVLSYEIEGPSGGLPEGSTAELYVRVIHGFVYNIDGSIGK